MIKSFARDHNSSSGPADAAGQDASGGASSKYKNLKKFQAHTRNLSTDLNNPSQPIRYIQNQLRPQDCAEEDDDDELTTGCGHFVKKHSRNHSYDQIYMPNNIRFDADFLRHPHPHHNPKKNVNVLKNVVTDVGKLKNSNEMEAGAAGSRGHSRNNSKDLNTKISSGTPVNNASGQVASDTSTTGLSVLRHRRTNSKDLNYQVLPEAAASSSLAGHPHPQHTRNTSHHKIQIDDDRNELINDNDDEDEERSNCA